MTPVRVGAVKNIKNAAENNMIKIAGIQFTCTENKKENIDKAVLLAEMAAREGAKIVCFHELFTTHWFPSAFDEKRFSLAEDVPGKTTEIFSRLAKDNSMVIICPLFEKSENGTYYNSAVVIDNHGKIIGKYRKAHIPSIPLWNEKMYFEPGDTGICVFKTDYACFGIQICWDNFFPEGPRVLALKGAQIIFAPTAAAFNSQQRWEKMICANAIANNLFVFRINRVGEEEKQHFYGKTFCCDPNGEFLSEPSGFNDAVVLANVNLDMVQSVRSEYAYLKNRRTDLYQDIVT